jgi:hypothetical protein
MHVIGHLSTIDIGYALSLIHDLKPNSTGEAIRHYCLCNGPVVLLTQHYEIGQIRFEDPVLLFDGHFQSHLPDTDLRSLKLSPAIRAEQPLVGIGAQGSTAAIVDHESLVQYQLSDSVVSLAVICGSQSARALGIPGTHFDHAIGCFMKPFYRWPANLQLMKHLSWYWPTRV